MEFPLNIQINCSESPSDNFTLDYYARYIASDNTPQEPFIAFEFSKYKKGKNTVFLNRFQFNKLKKFINDAEVMFEADKLNELLTKGK